jgi:hypothetical protein
VGAVNPRSPIDDALSTRASLAGDARQNLHAKRYTHGFMKILMTFCCIAVALALPVAAAEKAVEKKAAAPKKAEKRAERKAQRKKRVKIEKLACRLGTEDEHARIAVLLADGKVDSFAYYSKWKPRTCSMDVKRDDAFSKWEDTGNTTVVTLIEDKGAFLIENGRGRYHFIFRDIDRMRYCGMDGKVNGTLTIYRGKALCEVTGVMDREEPVPVAAVDKAATTPDEGEPHVGRPQAVLGLPGAAEEQAAGRKAAAPAASAGGPPPAK